MRIRLSKKTRLNIVNAVGFQTVWFASVVLQTAGLWLSIPLLALHIWFVESKKQELFLITLTAIVGLIVDSLLSISGLFVFADQQLMLGVIPLWLVVLWAGLAATLRHSFNGLFSRSVILPLVFGLLAPVSYFAGERLGAVQFGWDNMNAYIAISLSWLIATIVIQQTYRLSVIKTQSSP